MTTVCKFDDLVDGAAACHVIDGVAVAVVRIGDNVHAIDDVCSHANVSLSEGDVCPMRARLNAQNTEVRSV